MAEIMKKLLVIFFLLLITVLPVSAKDKFKMNAYMTTEFSLSDIPDEVEFKTKKKLTFPTNIVVPQRSIIKAEIFKSRRELRWHKSGFFICKIISYQPELEEEIDISDKEIYLIARRYEPINKKEAVITGTEILLTQAASFFAPGVDILYFFTKGAIQREKHPNWFKAGVSNAYDNSICWFWLKGKPIELSSGDEIRLKSIEKEKAEKIKQKIVNREEKDVDKFTQKELHKLKTTKLAADMHDYTDLAMEIDFQTKRMNSKYYIENAKIGNGTVNLSDKINTKKLSKAERKEIKIAQKNGRKAAQKVKKDEKRRLEVEARREKLNLKNKQI